MEIDWKWLVGLLPKNLLETMLWTVWFAFVAFSVTQLAKIVMRRILGLLYSDPFVYTVTVIAAFGSSIPSHLDDLLTGFSVGVAAWMLAFAAGRFGLGLIKWKWPGLWLALNMDRRKKVRSKEDENGNPAV